jgi:CheY-like chemotaxis protein
LPGASLAWGRLQQRHLPTGEGSMSAVDFADDRTQASSPMTILVVEDEVLISAMVSDVLLDRGYEVQVVSNANDAIRYLHSGLPLDVLFTDINIEGDVDGAVLAQHARELRPDLPIVFASGRVHLLEHLRAVPRAACLPKPYSPAQVCATVEGLFATRH